MHTAIVGMSRSGKSTLAMLIAGGLVKKGRKVGVFDPLRDPKWNATGAAIVTADPVELLYRCKTSQRERPGEAWHWFWEEWGPYLRNHPDPAVRKCLPAFAWLGTTSRQLGHSQWFLSHSWQDLLHVRGQCDQVFAFGQGHKSAALMAEDFAAPELAVELPRQNRLNFKHAAKMAEIRSGLIEFTRRGPRVRWR